MLQKLIEVTAARAIKNKTVYADIDTVFDQNTFLNNKTLLFYFNNIIYTVKTCRKSATISTSGPIEDHICQLSYIIRCNTFTSV